MSYDPNSSNKGILSLQKTFSLESELSVMTGIGKMRWGLALGGFILALASLALPVAIYTYGGNSIVFWYWALNIDTFDGTWWFNDDPLAVGGAILETIVILIAAIILLAVVKGIKKNSKSAKSLKKMLITVGILLIVSPVGYMIGGLVYEPAFFTKYTLSIGIFCTFAAAAIAIFDGIKCKE